MSAAVIVLIMLVEVIRLRFKNAEMAFVALKDRVTNVLTCHNNAGNGRRRTAAANHAIL